MLLGISLYYIMCCCRIYKINIQMSPERHISLYCDRHYQALPKQQQLFTLNLNRQLWKCQEAVHFWKLETLKRIRLFIFDLHQVTKKCLLCWNETVWAEQRPGSQKSHTMHPKPLEHHEINLGAHPRHSFYLLLFSLNKKQKI